MIKNKKQEKYESIMNMSDEEIDKLNYKEKQSYYKIRQKLGRISFVSKVKDGEGMTYVKPKKVNE